MLYHRRESWMIKEKKATDEALFVNRRKLIARLYAGMEGERSTWF